MVKPSPGVVMAGSGYKHRTMPKWLARMLILASLATPAAAEPIRFAVIGDVYPEDTARLSLLRDKIDAGGPAFVAKLGNLSVGVCTDQLLQQMHALLQTFKSPVVYVPGDNDWADCKTFENKATDAVQSPIVDGIRQLKKRGGVGAKAFDRLERIRDMFFAEPKSLGQTQIALKRHSDFGRFSAFREDVEWAMPGALFATINLTGEENLLHWNLPWLEAYQQRKHAHADWLNQLFGRAQAERIPVLVLFVDVGLWLDGAPWQLRGFEAFREMLTRHVANFSGRVFLVHTHSESFKIDQPLRDADTGEVLTNFTRVQAFRTPDIHALELTLRAEDGSIEIRQIVTASKP